MILRRIVENLKQQHWTSVFIELAVVVFGVFIGLQVDNWNQARSDRAAESGYLGGLREDVDVRQRERVLGRCRAEDRVHVPPVVAQQVRHGRDLHDPALTERAAKLLASNRDHPCPAHNGIRPGCGAIVAMLESASGRSASRTAVA